MAGKEKERGGGKGKGKGKGNDKAKPKGEGGKVGRRHLAALVEHGYTAPPVADDDEVPGLERFEGAGEGGTVSDDDLTRLVLLAHRDLQVVGLPAPRLQVVETLAAGVLHR